MAFTGSAFFSTGAAWASGGRGGVCGHEQHLGYVHDLDVGVDLLGALLQVDHAERASGGQYLRASGDRLLDALGRDVHREVVEGGLVAASCAAALGVHAYVLHLHQRHTRYGLDDLARFIEHLGMTAQVAWVMVGDLGLDLLGELELLFLDELVADLGEVHHRERRVRIVFAIVVRGGLVAPCAGHDHGLGAHALRLGDVVLRESSGEFGLARPQRRGGAAPFVLAQGVQLQSGTVHHGDPGLGRGVHAVGGGATGEEADIGEGGARDLLGPVLVAFGARFPIWVSHLLQTLSDADVGLKRALALLHHPLPHDLPELGELDVDMADGPAAGAASAFVQGVDELIVHLDLATKDGIHGGPLGQLVQVVHLAPRADRLPGRLGPGVADPDAVTTLKTSGHFPFDALGQFHHWNTSMRSTNNLEPGGGMWDMDGKRI